MVGRQTPFLALVVPLILIGMVDGRRGIRQAWPVAVVGGFSFALAQFACSNYISVELTDIVAVARLDGLHRRLPSHLDAWRAARGGGGRTLYPPGRGRRLRARLRDGAGDRAPRRHPQGSTARRGRAYAPYLIIIAVFSIAQIAAIKDWMAESPWTTTFEWPGLDVREAPTASRSPA